MQSIAALLRDMPAELRPHQINGWDKYTYPSSGSVRLTGRGNKLLRSLLVEVSWLMRRYNEQLRGVFDRVCRGSRTRRKIAVVATAKRLLVICWAMMRGVMDR